VKALKSSYKVSFILRFCGFKFRTTVRLILPMIYTSVIVLFCFQIYFIVDVFI